VASSVTVTRDAQLILVAGALLAAGVAASMVAARLRLPALVLFLGLGMLIGSDGLGWIYFDGYALARRLGTVALVMILFEGGLATGLPALRPVLRGATSLAIVGTAGTALIGGLMAGLLLHRPVAEGLLVGAILSPTDGAAVFALLRGVRLPRRLALTLNGEAGLNDPVAVLLVVVMTEVIRTPGYGVLDGVWFLAHEVVVGLVIGGVVGAVAVTALRRMGRAPSGLTLVASFATAAIAFGAAGSLGGSGFLAVYAAGLAVGSVAVPAHGSVSAFHEGLSAVAEISMFFVLGLLVFPSQLGSVFVTGTILALWVALVARPLAAYAATVRSGLGQRERVLVGWAGLRGGIPVVLATLPVIDHVPGSLEFFNLVFFAVLVSTVLQGATVQWLADRLGISATVQDQSAGAQS
jgi:cell volume regulation protein A